MASHPGGDYDFLKRLAMPFGQIFRMSTIKGITGQSPLPDSNLFVSIRVHSRLMDNLGVH